MQMRLWLGLAESAFGGSLESGGRFCVFIPVNFDGSYYASNIIMNDGDD
jgi:hypothetical protein